MITESVWVIKSNDIYVIALHIEMTSSEVTICSFY